MVWIGYAAAWISTAAATSVGLYYTHSPWCLLAMILPACIKIRSEGENCHGNS